MKILYVTAAGFLMAMISMQSSWSCGGGESIVLNDDTILDVNGLTFPITDPEN